MDRYRRVFGTAKPVIAMVHLGALPGAPLHDVAAGLEGLVEGARADLAALQAAGVDAVMFGNENDRPYEFEADRASTATMAYVVGRLRDEIRVPFGVNVLWDPMSTVALAAATGAAFVREIFTGTYASDMGPWTPDAGAAMRYRDRLGRKDCLMLYNVSAEFADSLDRRALPDRARSAVFSSIPDAVLVSGQITGEAAKMADLEAGEGGAAACACAGQYRRQARDGRRSPAGSRRLRGRIGAQGRRRHLEARRSGTRARFHGAGAGRAG
jgi:membrane complex biogenesis BtpA family protein